MKLKPRFSLALLLLLCAAIACSILAIQWWQTNTIIRSDVSGSLLARDGKRYPTNRWIKLPIFDPSAFYDDDFNPALKGKPIVLETNQGNFDATVELWRYEGSSDESFRVELKVTTGEQIK